MNYEIPEHEVENVLSVYWQMLREIECHTRPDEDPCNARLVEGAYRVLHRCGCIPEDNRPRWIDDNSTLSG